MSQKIVLAFRSTWNVASKDRLKKSCAEAGPLRPGTEYNYESDSEDCPVDRRGRCGSHGGFKFAPPPAHRDRRRRGGLP